MYRRDPCRLDPIWGYIRCRKEVSERLGHDVRQGVHARQVMESYQTWFGDGPELTVLRMLGLFDRPADEKALGALLKPPPIREAANSNALIASALLGGVDRCASSAATSAKRSASV